MSRQPTSSGSGGPQATTIVLPDEHASGEHARIVFAGERYVLRDLRSTNGTTVVRGTIASRSRSGTDARLSSEPGDLIELGAGDRVVRIEVAVDDDDARE